MENNKLSTGLTVWLWIIFVVNVLAAIGGIVVALGASVVGAALGLGSIYVVLSFIGVILQIVITVSIGILLFAHKKIGLVLIFAFAALGFIVSMVTYAVTAQLGVGNIVKAIISAILMPVITYLFAKNDIANGIIA
ncbi:hypothetical protein [Agathobacter rectalis]|uniref:Uncharacterized protein n=1 Tax=Agathobacter rectalis TaxID=39491 RepID=A0A6L5TDX4_9FIRM|nr:hypothetical protein [Agathobacter rectalis]MSC61544.1 hypothetical protein [Agathobacter rectalis]